MEGPLPDRWRALRQACQRVAAREVSDAPGVAELLDVIDDIWWILRTATAARDTVAVEAKRQGATWQQIGDNLRVDRQVAWRKYNEDSKRLLDTR